jgi:hypothetical protein
MSLGAWARQTSISLFLSNAGPAIFTCTDMKVTGLRSLLVALITLLVLVAAFFVAFKWWRRSHELPPIKSMTPLVLPNGSSQGTAKRRESKVAIQTGQERMSNAVQCLLYVVDLANSLPKERDGVKGHIAATAGVLYFDDCLMAKMENGYITITTNELRQSFSNALAQLFTNHVPPEVMEGFNKSFQDPTNMLGDFIGPANVSRDLVQGFKSSFRDRNNMHISVDEQYQRMAQSPQLARTLTAFDSAFQQAGIIDANQSDLKEMCLALGESRTSAYLMYGPHSDLPMPAENEAYAESLKKVLKWRLVNMYGLDDSAAEALVQALSRVPVNGFSHAGLQVPAFIQ